MNIDKKTFLVKANLYDAVIKRYGESKRSITLGGFTEIDSVPKEFEEIFWTSRIDQRVYYWDIDQEIKAMIDEVKSEGVADFQDGDIFLSIDEKPSYEEALLVLPTSKITEEDVGKIALDLKLTPSIQVIQNVIERYDIAQENDPSGTWDLIVEQLLYDELNSAKSN